jgi:hypothetical protein
VQTTKLTTAPPLSLIDARSTQILKFSPAIKDAFLDILIAPKEEANA